MYNLLTSEWKRLTKDKVFWLCLGVTLAAAIISMLNGCRQAKGMIADGYQISLEDYYYNLAPVIGLLCAVFSSLFLGTEYNDGTIRNKIIAGHTRKEIYLANLCVNLTAGTCFTLAWLTGSMVGIPFLGPWETGIAVFLLFALTAVFFTAAMIGIFTLLGMLCSNKAISAVTALLFFLALLIFASILYNRLCEPELTSSVVLTSQGIQPQEPTPNPNYVSGVTRTVYQFLVDFLPTGQSILLANAELGRPLLSILSSIFITAATTLSGIALFRRKDLK